MANSPISVLAQPLLQFKTFGEQANSGIQQMANGLAMSVSQSIDSLSQGTPTLPGLPSLGGQAAGMPSVKSLLPANLTQALSNIQNVIPGLPFGKQAAAPAPVAAPAAPASTGPTITTETPNSAPVAGRQVIAQRRGY